MQARPWPPGISVYGDRGVRPSDYTNSNIDDLERFAMPKKPETPFVFRLEVSSHIGFGSTDDLNRMIRSRVSDFDTSFYAGEAR